MAEKIFDGGDGFLLEMTHVGVTEESCWEPREGSRTGLALRRWVAGEPDVALQPPARVKGEKVSPEAADLPSRSNKPKLHFFGINKEIL